ncbi:MAG: inositol monophosphatase family protein [Longimicrobiales bacterium]|nr:inositol monophosphatase family protein [Longimicrobiales bacterium]
MTSPSRGRNSTGSSPDIEILLHTARTAADAATRVHRRHAGRVGVAEASEKGTSDFVSHVDLESQRAALQVIRERHPDHGILAEEADDEGDEDEEEAEDGEDDVPLWIVDPLDGTTNFLNRHPMYCASVAVYRAGEPLAAAVGSSTTSERWWAGRNRGAFKDGRRIRVSPLEGLRHALVGTGFPFKALDEVPRYLDELGRVLRSTAGVRRGGSAALDLCYLADGTFDGFWERHLKPWDIAAGVLIVREAGGIVTRLDESEIDFRHPGDGTVLGANSPEMLRTLGNLLRESDS